MKTTTISAGIFLTISLALGIFQNTSLAQDKDSTQCNINMSVSGMMCPMCSKRLEGKLKTIIGAGNVKADYKTGAVSFNLPDSLRVTKTELKKTISDLGFELKDVKFTEIPLKSAANKKQLKNNAGK